MDFGIPTITVVGEGIADGRSEAHAWNYGKWYGLDATFDDPIIRGGGTLTSERKRKFFLVGSQEFNGNHIPNGVVTPGIAFAYPELSRTKYSPVVSR